MEEWLRGQTERNRHELGRQWRTGKGWHTLKLKSRLDTGIRKSQTKKEKETGENKRASYVTLLDIRSLSYMVPQPPGPSRTQANGKQHIPLLSRGGQLPTTLCRGGLSIRECPCLCPSCPHNPGGDPTAAVSIPRSQQPPLPRQAGRQAGGAGRGLQDLPTSSPHRNLTILTYNNYHDDGADHSQHYHHLAVFPPVLPF